MALWLAAGLAIGVTYSVLLYRRAQSRNTERATGRWPRIDRQTLRLAQTAIVAVAAIWISWMAFQRPLPQPAPPVRCCEEKRKAHEPRDGSQEILGRTSGEIGIVGAILFGVGGIAFYVAGKHAAGLSMIAFSGLLTLSGAKLLPIDKIFEVKKAIGIDSLLTFNMNNIAGAAGSPVAPKGLFEQHMKLDHFATGRTELPSSKDLDDIKKRSPELVFLIGQADARELRNALLAQYGNNWTLATRRAQAVANYLAPAHSVISVTSPVADPKATGDKLALDRAVMIHAFFRQPAN
ncbi:MAG: hypothetical protein JWO97_2245 [Acidobacteria bacterium]|nr:hypothetical protein [Acidobacteriota bacterium]